MDVTRVIEEVKAEGKTRRVLWQDSESIAFLSSGRKERWDFHIDPADEVTLQLTGVQHLVYRDETNQEHTADIKAGQILLCPAGVPHSPRLEADSWFIVFERKRKAGEIDYFKWFCTSMRRESLRDFRRSRRLPRRSGGPSLSNVFERRKTAHVQELRHNRPGANEIKSLTTKCTKTTKWETLRYRRIGCVERK